MFSSGIESDQWHEMGSCTHIGSFKSIFAFSLGNSTMLLEESNKVRVSFKGPIQ